MIFKYFNEPINKIKIHCSLQPAKFCISYSVYLLDLNILLSFLSSFSVLYTVSGTCCMVYAFSVPSM